MKRLDKNIIKTLLFATAFVLLVAFVNGCGKSGSLEFGKERDVEEYDLDSLWTDYVKIIAGGETGVNALVLGKESREPKKDICVEFSHDIGDMDNHEVHTDSNGIATTTFHAGLGDSGKVATISALAYSRNEKDTTRKVISLEILPPSYVDPSYILLKAEPEVIYTDGMSEVELTAQVRDRNHSGISGHQVYFDFVAGDLGDLDLQIENNDPISDEDGYVKASFTAPSSTPRTISVSATVYGINVTVADTVDVEVLQVPDVDFLDLRADPENITADGESELTLSAYLIVAATGTPAPDGTPVTFYVDDDNATLLPVGTKASGKSGSKGSPTGREYRRRPYGSLVAQTESGYAYATLVSSYVAHDVFCKASAEIGDATVSDSLWVKFTAGSPYRIEVTSERSPIKADGSDTTLITAKVFDAHDNVVDAGKTVTFSTDKGDVSPTSTTTNSSGEATTVLTSGIVSGYARVTATCGDASDYCDVLLASTIPAHISLEASPSQIDADGTSNSTITAEVLDSNYAPVTDGVRIKFLSSLGTLSGVRDRERPIATRGKGKYMNLTADTRTATTTDGFCSVKLTSGYVADSCMVAAWYEMFDTLAGDTVITATDTVYVIFMPGAPENITVSFSRDSILADANDTATVFADVYDAYNNLVGTGHSVTFTPDDGGGTVDPPSDNTDASGRAQTVLTSSLDAGWHAIKAEATGANPGTGMIYFYPIIPQELRMLFDFDSATANGADKVLIQVYVTDEYYRPCSDGVQVKFRTQLGKFLPARDRRLRPMSIATAVSGEGANTEHRTPNNEPRERPDPRAHTEGGSPSYEYKVRESRAPMADSFIVETGNPGPGYAQIYLVAPTTAGTTWVWAYVPLGDGDTAIDSMQVAFVPDVPKRITLTAVPDTIPADNVSYSTIKAYITDAHFNAVGEGILVEFSMATGSEEYGHLTRLIEPTNMASKCSTNFMSHYLAGEAIINVKLVDDATVTQNVSVQLIGATPTTINLSTDSVKVHIGKTMGVNVFVYDSSGSPITDGTHVDLSIESSYMGEVNPVSPITTDGKATALFTPDTIAGSCKIIATVGAIADTKTVYIGPGPVAKIVLDADPDTLLSVGGERSNIVAACTDAYGNRAESGRDVTFDVIPSTMGGIFSPAATDSLGIARTYFTGGTIVGTAVIRASIDGAVETVPIEIVATGPAYVIVYTDSIEITVGDETEVHASVFDANGRPVSDDTRVDFTACRGTLDPPFGFTISGSATTVLHATTVALVDTVIASVDSGRIADTAYVHYVADCPVYISIETTPDSIQADGHARSMISATVKDIYNNFARPGTPIHFEFEPTITIIPGLISTPATVDSEGCARTIYRASTTVGTAAMIAKYINGNVGGSCPYPYYPNYPPCGLTAQTLFDVEQIEPIAAFITVSAKPNQVIANGVDSSLVTARVLNSYAEPVADGSIVRFYNKDQLTGATVGDMDTFAMTSGGNATVVWRAPSEVTTAIAYGEIYGLTDSAIVDFIPGDVARIAVEVEPDSVPADGQSRATVTAYAFDKYDNPVPGIEVNLEASPAGEFVSAIGNTDSIGQFVTYIYSTTTGHTTIMVTAEDADGNKYTDYAEVVFTPIVAADIYLTADTAYLVANGISTTTIHAFVMDSNSVSVPNNTPVMFSSDLGFVFPGVSYTTGGEATTTLRSATTVGTATITGDAGAGVTGNTTVNFIAGPPARITLTAIPSSIPADGDTFTTVQAIVYDLGNNLVSAGVKVKFTTTLGTIDTMGYTNDLGEATVRLGAGITPGSAVIQASSGSANAQTTVNFTSTDAAYIYVYLDPPELTADGYSTAEVTGRVINSLGTPVSDGTPVMLSVTTDSLGPYGNISPFTAHTDSGWFYATFTAGRNIGTAYIIAEASPTVLDSVIIELVPGPPDSIYIEANPTSLPADSFSTSNIHVEIFDKFANPVTAGDTVTFSANKGTVEPDTETTNSAGQVDVVFTAGRTPGEARVRAAAGNAHAETYIILTNSDVTYISVTIDTSQIVANGLSTTFIRAHVSDSIGMPVSDGTPVYFSIDTVAGSPADTDMALITPIVGFTHDGEAAVQIRAGTQTGRVYLSACTDSVRCGDAFIDLIAGPVDSIEAWADDYALPANGEAFTIVHARLYDRYDNALSAGTKVEFSTTGGTIDPTDTWTNSAGQVDAIFTAGTVPTMARVDISSGTRHAIVQIALDIAPPAYLSLRADPRRIAADGVTKSTITAKVLNELGRPINDGTMVVFHSVDTSGATFGSIETLATTVDGIASVDLYSEPNTGVAYVSARVDSLSDTIQVTFTPGPPHHVDMQAIPSVLYANGSSVCTVRTWVYDEFDNLVESGERVSFDVGPSSNLGVMFPSYTYSDVAGPSDVTFQAGIEVGRAVITGTCESGPAGYVLVDLIPLTVGAIDLFTDSLRLTADGVSATNVRAIVLDTSGVGVSDSTPIFFTTTAGNVFPGVGYTNGGEAVVKLRSSSDVDTATVVAYVGTPGGPDYIADTAYVRFVAGEPYLMDVVPDSATLLADGNSRTDVWTYVFDALGNPVDPGHIVRFSTTLGTIDSLAVTQNPAGTTGVAITQLQSGIIPGTALITATSGDAMAVGRVDFIPANVAELFATIEPDILTADGHSMAEISGMVRNTLANPITDGTPVHIYTLPGPGGQKLADISPATAYTDSGQFTTTLTSGTIAAGCQIVCYVGDTLGFYVSDTLGCELTPGEPDSINLVASIGTLPADSFSVDTIRAYLFDRFGNPVEGGVEVSFSTSRGEVFPVTDETNSAGMVQVYLRSSFEAGVARVVARSGDARGEVNVTFTPTNVFTVALTVDDVTMQADGYSETIVRATVLDSLSNPVSNGTPVTFSMWPDTIWDTLLSSSDTLGSLIPTIAYTDGGLATTNFRVTTMRGRVWIRATVGTVSDEVFIQILPGDLSYIAISANPDTISANGRDQSQVTATLFDDFGNRLLSGNTVQFGTDLGSVGPPSTMTNSAGDAFAILIAGTEPGIARVYAQSEETFELTQVVLRKSNIGTILMTADPVELVADGMSQSVITAQVFDKDGSPVSDGTQVSFRVRPTDTAGTVVSPKLTVGGSCVTIFTSSTIVGRGSAWIIGEVIDTFAVPADTLTDSVRIFIKPGPPTTINVWADTTHTPRDTIWADGADDIFIFAEVLDQYGNRLKAGETVTFSTSLGSITPSTITDTMGIAKSLLTAGLTPGDAVILVYCGSALGYGQVNMRATTVDNVLLTADTTILRADGVSKTKLRAYVYSAGGHLVSDETQVTFEVPSGFAHPQPADAYTDSGVAIIDLRSDTIASPGIEVWAIAGGDTGKITIRLEPGPPSRIVSYASDDTIYADGASVTAIACTVFDRYPNPVSPGTPVSFETTLGSIIPTGYTNTYGYAFSRLTAGTQFGVATVKIQCGGAIDFLDIVFDSLTAAELTLNVQPALLPGDGSSTADVTAYVYDAGGLPVSDNTRVTFTQDTTGGRPRGIITPRIAFTSGGQATATLTSPVDVGTGRIIASVGATVADTFTVTYEPGEPATIEFDTAYADTLPADGGGYDIVVRVYDAYHNPVKIGTQVNFTTTRGDIIPTSVVDSDSGTARTLISSMATGPALVQASSGTAVGSHPYYFYPLTADIIDLVANPIRILADGVSTSNLLASVLDTTGGIRPVSDNTPVFFESRGGGIVTPRTAYTVDGQVNAQLVAGITTGPDTVIATVGTGIADTVVVDFIAGPPAIVDFVDPIRNMYADGKDTQTVWVEVTDAYGNEVSPGLPVSFGISLGDITPSSATDDTGFTSAVIMSGTEFGTASISALCSGVSGYATLNFLALAADSLLLVVNPPQLVANGVDDAELTAVVFDSTGLPVSDGTLVSFGTSNGILSPAVAYTDGGVATSTLIAGTTPAESVWVTASAGGSALDSALARFIPGPPAVMYISASDSIITANGSDTTRIFVEVYDQFGNPVSPGEEVSFSATLGNIIPAAYTDSLGRASVRLVAGDSSGFSNVTASAGDAEASILIEFTSTKVADVMMTVIPTILTADGASNADVLVIVLDSLGNPVSDGTTVRFSGLSLGSVSPVFTTTFDGEANATVTSYTSIGWDSLVATSGDTTDTVAIKFVPGPPAYIWLTPGKSVMQANLTDTTLISGDITDAFGNPVGAGLAVYFTIQPSNYGTIWAMAATDSNGHVEVPFKAGQYAGVAIIRATCESAEGVTQIELTPTDVAEISLSISDRYLPADGVSSADVTAFVTDTSGMDIADGTIVRFAQDTALASVEGLLNPNRESTLDGEAAVTLFAPTVTGSTFVYAYIDTIYSDTVSVYFQPGDVAVVRFGTSYAQLYADGSDTLADTVWVEDAFGNGISGAAVTFTLADGTVTPPIGVTGPTGGVRFKITSPNKIGSTYLTATSGGVSGYLPIDYLPTTVDTIILSVSPRGLPADGTSMADVRATVADSLGNPVSDGVVVRFSAQLGLITPLDSLLSGMAEAVLTSADTSGVDTIFAICQSETAKVTVTYEAGAPDEITLDVVPDTATVGSPVTSSVFGMVTDASGNPVAPGTYVYLSVDSAGMGSVADPVVATDDSGYYSTLYTPGLKSGLTGITATVDGLVAHTNLLLKAGPPHTMDITVSRDFIYVRGVGEIDQSVLEAVIYDQYDNPVRDSSAVVFRIVVYPAGVTIDPELIPNHPTLALYSDTVYTIGGRASVTLRAGDMSGSIVVEARAELPGGGTLTSRAPRITVASGLPYHISVSVGDCNIRGWLTDGLANSVMAIVTDTFENPVAPGTAVWFTSEEGAVTSSATTNDSGFAFGTWYSSDPRNDGIVWIYAETRDTLGIRRDSVAFYNSGPAATISSIDISPPVVYADESGIAEIRVSMEDVNGNPVTDSSSVNVIASWGEATSPTVTTNECYGSYAISEYTGANVFRDDFSAQDTAISVEVTANIGSVSGDTTFYLKHDLPSSEFSMITAPGSVPYNATYMVSVKIVDQWNNPIYGESVDLTATGGTVNAPNPTTTNKTGEASWSVTAPDTSSSSTEVLMVEIVSTGAVLNTSIKYTTKRKRPSMEEDEEYSNKPPEAAVEPKNTELYLTDEK